MLEDRTQRHKLKKDAKRRLIALCVLIPFGIAYASLFFMLNKFSNGVQILLTVVCWGATFAIYELLYWWISKLILKKNKNKPKTKDPFAD